MQPMAVCRAGRLGRGRIGELTRWLLVAAVVQTAVAVGLASVPGPPQTEWNLDSTVDFLRMHGWQDSWRPMSRALAHVRSDSDRGVYEAVLLAEDPAKRQKFQYPPTSLLLIEPLAWLGGADPRRAEGAETIRNLGNVLGWISVLGSMLLGMAMLDRSLALWGGAGRDGRPGRSELLVRGVCVLVLGLSFGPLMRSFAAGQIQAWLTFWMLLAMLLWLHGRRAGAGVLIGLCAVVKPPVGLVLIWALARGQMRFVVGAGTTGAVLGLAGVLLYGWGHHADYVRAILLMSGGEAYYLNHSVNGVLLRLLGDAEDAFTFDRTAFGEPFAWVVWSTRAVVAAGLVGLVVLGRAGRRREGREGRFAEGGEAHAPGFCAGLLLCTLLSPIAWDHHYGLAFGGLILGLAAVDAGLLSRSGRWWLLASLVLMGNYLGFVNGLLWHTRWAAFLSGYVWLGGLILLVLLWRADAALVGRGTGHAGSPR